MEAARELNQLDDQLYTEGLGLFEHALGTFGSQVEIDAAAMTRAGEIVGASANGTPDDGDRRAQRIDARAKEILADTRALLASELVGVSRRAERLVSYGELVAETPSCDAESGRLRPRRAWHEAGRRNAGRCAGVASGLEEHARNLAADMRSLVGREDRLERSAAEPDELAPEEGPEELVSVDSAPLNRQ